MDSHDRSIRVPEVVGHRIIKIDHRILYARPNPIALCGSPKSGRGFASLHRARIQVSMQVSSDLRKVGRDSTVRCDCRSLRNNGTALADLLAPHCVVQTLALQQLIVVTVFNDLSKLQYVDSIGVKHGRQAVRDEDGDRVSRSPRRHV